MIRFVDLFAGIGGIRLGLENACASLGVATSCVLSSEIDFNARSTYQLNFSEEPSGDITQISEFPDFDLLLAGFPCQPFSHAGPQRGFEDTRGTLFFEVARVLKDKQPRGFILENVQGLTTNDGGRTFETILKTLRELGYGVRSVLLNSCNFGLPQNRLRVFILGLRDREPALSLHTNKGPYDSHVYKKRMQATLFPEDSDDNITVKDILQPRVEQKYQCTERFVTLLSRVVGGDYAKLNGVRLIDYRGGNSIHSWDLGIKGECTPAEVDFMTALIANRRKHVFGRHQDGKKLTLEQIRTFYKQKNIKKVISGLIAKGYLKLHGDRYDPVCGNMSFEVFKFLDPDSISITVTSTDAHRLGVVQNNVPRRITPRECARLQGFPDSFKPHPIDKFAYQQFGNSVSVPVVEAVAKDFLVQNSKSLKLRVRQAS